jgi:hypothetical protein
MPGRKKGSSSKDKGPQLVVKGKRHNLVSLNIRNGGAAAKIFLLKSDGTFDTVVPANKYAEFLKDEKIARSKRGLEKGQNGYLARGCVIKSEQKDEVVAAVSENFKALQKMIASGELKAATARVKTEIIPLG